MASISHDGDGRRRILFTAADGKRKAIRLGKCSERNAEAVRLKVEDLVAASITGHAPSDEASRWVATLDDALHSKLARVRLVKSRTTATIGAFTRAYIDGRRDIKQSTRIKLERIRSYLLECFDERKRVRDFTRSDGEAFRQHMIGSGRAENTTRRAIAIARQFFRAAVRDNLAAVNAFDGLSASVRGNADRMRFIKRQDIERVIEACPSIEWKLIFALARYGGLRCPSEVLALKWSDVDWENERVRVPSPKTAGQGKPSRVIPLFPELRPLLLAAFEAAEEGAEYVITQYRRSDANLGTQAHRIIRKAGLEPWPKTFQNLRSTRETELADEFPIQVVCAWIGNSQPVAMQHYLQLTEDHFARAVRPTNVALDTAAQNPAQNTHEPARTGRNKIAATNAKTPAMTGVCEHVPSNAERCKSDQVGQRGLEPPTSPLSGARSSQLSY